MAKKRYFLSEDDVRLLKLLADQERKRRGNSPLRSPNPEDDINKFAPEVFVAVPTETIPAWTDTIGAHGKAGMGAAELCFIDDVDQGIDEIGFDHLIYNLTETDVAVDSLNLVIRDKFGRYVIAAGGGGASSIWAVVTEKRTFDGRGQYKCREVEWLPGGNWHLKVAGRIFVNCWEASTRSNANIQRTDENIVQLWKVPTPPESSVSSQFGSFPSSSFAESSGANPIDEDMYVFDKALGFVSNPVVI